MAVQPILLQAELQKEVSSLDTDQALRNVGQTKNARKDVRFSLVAVVAVRPMFSNSLAHASTCNIGKDSWKDRK
jgi:hypothetical protein